MFGDNFWTFLSCILDPRLIVLHLKECHCLVEHGIFAPDLCLFGYNAYLNTAYMATPYAAISGGSKDSYNF
jgi:hypothetical protein